MYYNDPDEAANLAQKDGFSIFVHRNSAEFLQSFIKLFLKFLEKMLMNLMF